LELGVLKLVHAQRILPLEQVLSQVAGPATETKSAPRQSSSPVASPGAGQAPRRSESPVSPFEADRSRKGRSFDPEMSDSTTTMQPQPAPAAVALATEVEPSSDDPGVILGSILSELEGAGHRMLASLLEAGSAMLSEGELKITVSQPASVLDIMMNPETKRLASAAASRAAGRVMKV